MKLPARAACLLLALAVFAGPAASARSHKAPDNMYGGPIYSGPPDVITAGSFITAGGGAKTFTTRTALNNVIGVQLVDPEIETLQKQYGVAAVRSWLRTFDFVIRNGAQEAIAAGLTFPAASPTHTGQALFTAMMQDGMDHTTTFWTGTMLDKLVTHPVHASVMRQIDETFGADADADYHKITNQFVFDVAVQLGIGDTVKLSPDH